MFVFVIESWRDVSWKVRHWHGRGRWRGEASSDDDNCAHRADNITQWQRLWSVKTREVRPVDNESESMTSRRLRSARGEQRFRVESAVRFDSRTNRISVAHITLQETQRRQYYKKRQAVLNRFNKYKTLIHKIYASQKRTRQTTGGRYGFTARSSEEGQLQETYSLRVRRSTAEQSSNILPRCRKLYTALCFHTKHSRNGRVLLAN